MRMTTVPATSESWIAIAIKTIARRQAETVPTIRFLDFNRVAAGEEEEI